MSRQGALSPRVRPSLPAAAALPFALASAGCGKVGCFEYTEVEYEVGGNACPPPEDAEEIFNSGPCKGPVESVDSEGKFDGDLCCYDTMGVSFAPPRAPPEGARPRQPTADRSSGARRDAQTHAPPHRLRGGCAATA